jgi:hypothetical protein
LPAVCWLGGFGEEVMEASGVVLLRQRNAPLVVLPSAALRARYAFVSASWLARVIAMMCSAWLSWRSPPWLRRCCCRWPEEHGIGAVPHNSAKLASERNRWAPGGAADQNRGGQGSAAGLGEQLRAVRPDEFEQLKLELLGLAVDGPNPRDLLARDPGPLAGRHSAQLPVDPVEHARLVKEPGLTERSSSGLRSSRCHRSRLTVRVRSTTKSWR